MLSEATVFLEQAYNVINKIYFQDNLPMTIISIQSSPKTYGHVTMGKIWNNTDERVRELNISAEYLDRKIEDLLATLLHEMVHIFAMENNIADTSKGGRYHNKRFKELCEERDLQIDYVKYIGYSKTTPTQAFIEKLKSNGLYVNKFNTNRLTEDTAEGAGGGDGNSGNTEGNKGKTGKKNYVRKYLCISCGKSTRSTTDMNIGCLDCGVVMVNMNKTVETNEEKGK